MIKADIDNIVVDSPHVEFRSSETGLDSFSSLSENDCTLKLLLLR